MRVCRILLTILVVIYPAFQPVARAEQMSLHVVPTEELQRAVAAKFVQRELNIQVVETMLRHEAIQKQVGRLVGLERIAEALPTLSDETLNQLATESRKVNDQLQAGVSGIAWLLIAGAAAAAIIIIVVATDDDEDNP